jgi:phage tail-like protein
MTDPNAAGPAPKFVFQVTGLGGPATFEEAVGLATRAELMAHAAPGAAALRASILPAPPPQGDVTLKNGVFIRTPTLWDWFSAIQMNTVPSRTIVVSLLDDAGAPQVIWTLENAKPTKFVGPDLEPNGVDVALEALELVFENLTMTYN